MSGLSQSERLDRLRLARSQNVGPVTFRDLLTHFGTATAALDALPALAARGGRPGKIKVSTKAAIEREWEALEKLGGRFLLWGDSDFPAGLAAIDPPPPLIAVLGHAHLLGAPILAMVGSRNASASGAKLASQLAADLGQEGFVIASGLARGIDTAAHKAALATGTVAVLGGGLDVIYPEQNTGLYHDIREQGALVSEMPLGTQPRAQHFPRRNRVISGLSQAVIVVEAALRSGSLITARYAAEQGRDVLATPGSPLDPRAKGTNNLIKQGAGLIENAQDVLTALALRPKQLDEPEAPDFATAKAAPHSEPDNNDRARILACLSPAPIEVDEIIRHTELPTGTVIIVLIELDLAGRIERHTGQKVSLIDLSQNVSGF